MTNRYLQPLLHDLVGVVLAPTSTLSGQDGQIRPAGVQGVFHADARVLSRAELLVDYLGISEKQLAKAVERLEADGKYELAASLLESSEGRFEHSKPVAKARRLVYLKLMEKNQNTDPFKYILYSAKIGEQTQQMAATPRP